jgi:hypothetical protein
MLWDFKPIFSLGPWSFTSNSGVNNPLFILCRDLTRTGYYNKAFSATDNGKSQLHSMSVKATLLLCLKDTASPFCGHIKAMGNRLMMWPIVVSLSSLPRGGNCGVTSNGTTQTKWLRNTTTMCALLFLGCRLTNTLTRLFPLWALFVGVRTKRWNLNLIPRTHWRDQFNPLL